MRPIALATIFIAVSVAGALAADQNWSGTVSDSMCKAKHTMTKQGKPMEDRECTQACASHGAQYTLVVDGKAYKLRNRDTDLRTHAGHLVHITGELAGDTIRVAKIEMPKPEDR